MTIIQINERILRCQCRDTLQNGRHTLSSAFGLACEYSRNSLLPSARLGTFCGREICDSARLGRKRFRSRKSKVEARAKKMEVGGGGKEKGFLHFPFPSPSPYFFPSIYLIIFLSSSSFRALTRLGSKKILTNDVNQCLHNQSSW